MTIEPERAAAVRTLFIHYHYASVVVHAQRLFYCLVTNSSTR